MYRVEVAHTRGSLFKVKSKDCELLIDTEGKGVTPPDALLAALGGCMGVYLRKYAETAKLALGDFSIIVEAEFSREGPACFREIGVSVDLKGIQLEERRRNALLEFIKNCPVHNTLKINPVIKISIT